MLRTGVQRGYEHETYTQRNEINYTQREQTYKSKSRVILANERTGEKNVISADIKTGMRMR
jgi:hypothetical protein